MNILAFTSIFSACLFVCSYLIRLGNYFPFAELITFSFFSFFIFSNILLLYVRRAHFKVVPNIADLLVFILFVSAVPSLVYAGPTNAGILYFGQLTVYGILPYLILRLVPRESSEFRFFFVSAALILLLSVFLLAFVLGVTESFARFRLGGEIINPVGVGAIYLILSLFLFGAAYYANTRFVSFCYTILFLVSLSMLVLSGSRSSILAMLLMAFIGFFIKSKTSFLKLFLVLVTAIFLVTIADFSLIDEAYFIRYTDLFSADAFDSGSVGARVELFSLSKGLIADNPTFGLGLYGFQLVTNGDYPHNLIVEVLISFGVPLGLLIILLIALSVATPYKYFRTRKNDPRLVLFFVLIAILIVKMFSFNLAQMKDFFVFLGFLISFTSDKNKFQLRPV